MTIFDIGLIIPKQFYSDDIMCAFRLWSVHSKATIPAKDALVWEMLLATIRCVAKMDMAFERKEILLIHTQKRFSSHYHSRQWLVIRILIDVL